MSGVTGETGKLPRGKFMAATADGSDFEKKSPAERFRERAAELWKSYFANPDDEETKDALIRGYLPLVKAELRRMKHHLPKYIDVQDLYADGAVGLLSALAHFDPQIGVDFEVYARKRIWGAMLDRVRALDGVPRSARQAARRLERAVNDFLNEHDRQPDEAELAAAVGVSVEELHVLERQAGLTQSFSLDALADADGGSASPADKLSVARRHDAAPLDRLDAEETKAALVEGLRSLPERERGIMVLYYNEGLMLKEIAAAMGVSESRVSQLHGRALIRLRAFFERRETDAGHPASVRNLPRRPRTTGNPEAPEAPEVPPGA